MFDSSATERDASAVPTSSDVPWSAPGSCPRESSDRAEAPRAVSPVSPVSPVMAALVAAVDAVLAQVPAELPGSQALADTAVLLQQVERLRAGSLGRLADVEHRTLNVLDGAGSASSWVAEQQTSLDRGEVALARRMGSLPRLEQVVRDGGLSIVAAERVGKALSGLRRHVDRPDGLIDGQDGEQALVGVIGHGVRRMVCEALGGLAEDDPRLVALVVEAAAILASPASQLARLEAGFVLLAQHLEPAQLPGALGQLVDALLPNELEKKAKDAHAQRGFTVRLNADGDGFMITEGALDLECGELLQAFLDAELAVDEDNPTDTAEFERLREQGWGSGDELPDRGLPGPRSLRQRRHDVLSNGLRRYLNSGTAGTRDKAAPHLDVLVGIDQLEQHPGALPAVSARTGARLPASLVRRWMADSSIARFVLGLGGKVIEASHRERTLKPHERRAKRIETGGWCQASGCPCGPGKRMTPHHGNPWRTCRTTSLADTVNVCKQSHHDLHSGKKTLRLKDGRWLDEEGWTDGPKRG